MESVPLLSSQDGSGRVQLEGFGPTRNRKVVGSNPTSGSKTAGLNLIKQDEHLQVDQAVAPELLNLTSVHHQNFPPRANGAAAPVVRFAQ
jgi:hypothetical protein